MQVCLFLLAFNHKTPYMKIKYLDTFQVCSLTCQLHRLFCGDISVSFRYIAFQINYGLQNGLLEMDHRLFRTVN